MQVFNSFRRREACFWLTSFCRIRGIVRFAMLNHTFYRTAPGLLLWAVLPLAAALLSGCSEMRILDQPMHVVEQDPREDIRMTNIETDITSAGLVVQRVFGRDAIYAQSRNILDIEKMRIKTFNPETGVLQGETEAATGTIYLANHPEAQRNRSDMEFIGGVTYRAPSKEDPTTDGLSLETEKLILDNASGRFIGPSTHTIMMAPPGKTPIFMQGKTLRASRDLSNFSVQGGSMSPTQSNDTATSYIQKKHELELLSDVVDEQVRNPPPKQTPLVVGPPPEPPTRPAPPELPPMGPRPTPTPRP